MRIKLLITATMIGVFLAACSNPVYITQTTADNANKVAVQFSFGNDNETATTLVQPNQIVSRALIGTTVPPDVAKIVVSVSARRHNFSADVGMGGVTNQSNYYSEDGVIDNRFIEIYRFGNRYYSEPLYLTPTVSDVSSHGWSGSGHLTASYLIGYTVTGFFVLNYKNEVLYASPKSGSKMAYTPLVTKTLNYPFTTGNGAVALNMDVVSIGSNTMEDFGYSNASGFGFSVVPTFDITINSQTLTDSTSPTNQATSSVGNTGVLVTYNDGSTTLLDASTPGGKLGSTMTLRVKDNMTSYKIKFDLSNISSTPFEKTFTLTDLKSNPVVSNIFDVTPPKYLANVLIFDPAQKTSNAVNVQWWPAYDNDAAKTVKYVAAASTVQSNLSLTYSTAPYYKVVPNSTTGGVIFSDFLTATSTYTFKNLTPGTTYFVTVYATDGIGKTYYRYSKLPDSAVTTNP